MLKWTLIVVAFLALLLSLPFVGRKRSVPLRSQGKVVAVATRPMVSPRGETEYEVYAGKTKIFGLWADIFDFPAYIYPFSDGKRFLCVYDYDTAVLVFVVDLRPEAANIAVSSGWPPDGYTRDYLAKNGSNVVIGTNGKVRLPNFAEVQEAHSNLAQMSQQQYRTAAFPSGDFGVYRFYWPKEKVLSDLASNRTSVWP